MSNFFKKFKKLVFGKKDADEIMGSIEEFNSLTKSYINVLNRQISAKEESISRIRVLVQDMNPKKRAFAGAGPQLNITLVDMNQTKITQKGKGSNNKKMDWEKNFSKMKGDQGVMI